jgi:hypothetical protein
VVTLRRSDAAPRVHRAAAAAVREALRCCAAYARDTHEEEEALLKRLADGVSQRLPGRAHVLVSRGDVLVNVTYQRGSLVRARLRPVLYHARCTVRCLAKFKTTRDGAARARSSCCVLRLGCRCTSTRAPPTTTPSACSCSAHRQAASSS